MMKVTYYGHSCFAAQVANKTLLFDPFITGNELAKAIDVKTVHADYILISHGHADHMGDAVTLAKGDRKDHDLRQAAAFLAE